MRIVDEGTVAHRSERGSYMPGIEPLPDGSFIACQFTASHFTASDARIEILRSTDGLATWTNEGEIKGPGAAAEGWSYRGARMYCVPGGRLLLKTTRFDASKISQTFDAASETLQQPENIILWSDDTGRTWSAPQLVDAGLDPARYTANGSGDLLQIAPDRWMYPLETWKPVGYDGPPDQKALAMFSSDQGATWGDLTVVADDTGGTVNWWDHVGTVLPDGRIYETVWAHVYREVRDLPNHWLISEDQGRTWSTPRPTNLMGQMCAPVALADGRVAAVYAYRREPQGIRVAITKDLEHYSDETVVFDAGAEAILGSPDNTSLALNMAQGFGRPGGRLLPDGDLLVFYWGTRGGVSHTRWARLSVEDS